MARAHGCSVCFDGDMDGAGVRVFGWRVCAGLLKTSYSLDVTLFSTFWCECDATGYEGVGALFRWFAVP